MSQPQALKCPSCTASLNYDGRSETIRCEFCGTTMIVPESMKSASVNPGIVGDEAPDVAINVHEILRLVQAGKKIEAIKLYRETFNVSLADAKTAVDHLAHGQPTAVTISTGTVATTTAASSGCGCILPLIIFLTMAGIGSAIFFFNSPDEFARLTQAIEEGDFSQVAEDMSATISNKAVFGDPIPLTQGGDGVGADLLLETWTYGGQEIPVRIANSTMEDGRRTLVWEADIGNSGDSQYNVSFDAKNVYVAKGSSLQAFNRNSGDLNWETVLSDEVRTTCTHCIRSLKERVVVLTADNFLEAFDTNTGRSVWQVRLASEYFAYPDTGQIPFGLTNEMVIIQDAAEVNGRNESGFYLFDINTGEAVRQLVPTCPDMENFFDDDTISDDAQIFINENSGELVALYGTSFVRQMCLQKWDLTTGEPLLDARLPEGFEQSNSVPDGMSAEWSDFLFGQVNGNHLLTALEIVGDDGRSQGLAKLDLTSGEVVLQIADADYALTPIGEVDDVLFVWAERSRGSKQNEIWGVSPITGERVWRHIINADYHFSLSPANDRFSYHLEPDGLVVLQMQTDDEPTTLVMQKLNPADGTFLYETESPIDETFWRGLTWTADAAYLTLQQLVAVDLETGETAVEWP